MKIRITAISISLITVIQLLLLQSCNMKSKNVRDKINFNSNWKFELSDSQEYSKIEFNDADWRILELPHDWSIEGKFSNEHPSGVGGGALPGGIGWYRKSFSLPKSDSLKRIYLAFDGVYRNSEVFINGKLLGTRPNGYLSFEYDLSPYLNYGDKTNTIAVRVNNSDQPNSRWYTGSGIYRNVWLKKTHPIHINLWGTYVTTDSVTENSANIEISIEIKNTSKKEETIIVETLLLDNKDKIIAKKLSTIGINKDKTTTLTQKLIVNTPRLWSIENPILYKAVSTLKLNNKKIDTYETTFGIRFFDYDSAKGFSLNGVPTKILGVCNHHDLGALGTAMNKRAVERQLEILKEMGCNGIRTSHNPPAPELLDLCDKMGFIVMNETFDMWKKKKSENDYSKYWDEWHVKDLTDHLLRDRNHPCIFSWSIGNEILEQFDTSGITIAQELAAIVKKHAPGIPITAGCNEPTPTNNIIKSGSLDLIGYNYKHEIFEQFPKDFPKKKFIATETTSSLHSRGIYNMPSDSIRIWPVQWDIPFYDGNPDNSCSSYDNCHVPWGSTHEETWKLIKTNDFISGFYIWTGFDYLGEPTPYLWPSRSSYFGIIDLAGFPKDVYYMYQSEWTDKDVLHIFPHWNWTVGESIDIWAYTNYDEVELFVNEKSLGTKSKQSDELHIMWRVKYEPGELKAIGRKTTGETKEVKINTAGEPEKIILEADRGLINADGVDLSFITVSVLDRNNNLVPYAENKIDFEVSENIKIEGVDNGKQTSHESFKANSRKAFNGKCLVILKSGLEAGEATLKATSKGLETAFLTIKLK